MEQWRKDMNAAIGVARATTNEDQYNSSIAQAKAIANTSGTGATQRAVIREMGRTFDAAPDPGPDPGPGPGPGSVTPTATYAPVVPPAAFSAQQILENLLFMATGVSGLGGWAADLSNRGASPTEIVQALRYGTDTSESGQRARTAYLTAFPDMDKFIKEGIFAGESPELQYISYRNTVREAGQRYGIDEGLLDNSKIAKYIGGRTSALELVDRMNTAATAAATTPAETYSIMNQYYGVKQNDLISFYLDPETTEATLQKRYTAARIGTEATRQKFGINVTEAENLAQRGVSTDEANKAFGDAARQSGFMQGRGDVVTRDELLGAVFGDAEAAAKAERVAGARRGRFEGGGQFISGQEGITGLGVSGM